MRVRGGAVEDLAGVVREGDGSGHRAVGGQCTRSRGRQTRVEQPAQRTRSVQDDLRQPGGLLEGPDDLRSGRGQVLGQVRDVPGGGRGVLEGRGQVLARAVGVLDDPAQHLPAAVQRARHRGERHLQPLRPDRHQQVVGAREYVVELHRLGRTVRRDRVAVGQRGRGRGSAGGRVSRRGRHQVQPHVAEQGPGHHADDHVRGDGVDVIGTDEHLDPGAGLVVVTRPHPLGGAHVAHLDPLVVDRRVHRDAAGIRRQCRRHHGARIQGSGAARHQQAGHHHRDDGRDQSADRERPLRGRGHRPAPHVIPSAGISGTRPHKAKVNTMSMKPIMRIDVRSARPAARPTPSGPPEAW